MQQPITLKMGLSPGDVLTLTAAVESLHARYPGRFATAVDTPAAEIWEHNPHIVPATPDSRVIHCHYPAIHRSNQRSVPFLAAYTEHLADALQVPLRLVTNRPHLYLSQQEVLWVDQVREHHTGGRRVPFWLVAAGTKSDFTCKQWPVESYQAVVDATRGRIQWVQVGAREHDHPPLAGAIDCRGHTDLRQLIRLAYHCSGGLGPVTLLQHLCAAWDKPYICLLGGREPVPWVTYPRQHTLHTIGALDCCRHGACWRSRVVPLGDGERHDQSLCERPIVGLAKPSPACMAMIQPQEVVTILDRYRT